jgi:hypothetical protein
MNIRSLSSIRMVAVAPMPRHASSSMVGEEVFFAQQTSDSTDGALSLLHSRQSREQLVPGSGASRAFPNPSPSPASGTRRILEISLVRPHDHALVEPRSTGTSSKGWLTPRLRPIDLPLVQSRHMRHPHTPFARMRCIESRRSALFLSKRASAMFSIAHGKSSAA